MLQFCPLHYPNNSHSSRTSGFASGKNNIKSKSDDDNNITPPVVYGGGGHYLRRETYEPPLGLLVLDPLHPPAPALRPPHLPPAEGQAAGGAEQRGREALLEHGLGLTGAGVELNVKDLGNSTRK